MRAIVTAFLIVFLAAQALCTVKTQDNAISRQVLGSNGPYRDFQRTDCHEPHETNPYCSDWQFAYHWNNALMDCERAIYHGCNPTRNNFRTLRDCKTQAEPVCKSRRQW